MASKTDRLLKSMRRPEPKTPIADEMFLPNYSGVNRYLETTRPIKHTQTQPTRSLDTTYQNTTGNPIIVYGDVLVNSEEDDSNFVELKTDGSSPPTTIVQKTGSVGILSFSPSNRQHQFSFYMVVAHDDFYRIDATVNGDGAVTLGNWNEVNF